MSAKEKISPAFDPFLAESRRNDKRDAIVIYRTPLPKAPPVSGRAGQPQKRLSYLKEVAALTEGGGGGRPEFAQAGGKNASKISEALVLAEKKIKEAIT